eukprot:m.261862 g.261862  ORF g.261862 m.261862 type:complete len:98 (+) comp40449_c1_seq67:804-1097(+)
MIDILANGSLLMKGMVRFVLAQAVLCQASVKSKCDTDIPKKVLSSVVASLEGSFTFFKRLQATLYMKQVLNLQLRVLRLLKHEKECDECAKTLEELI